MCNRHVEIPATVSSTPFRTRKHEREAERSLLVPIRVQRLFDDGRGMNLLPVDGDDRERVREAEDVALDQAVRGDDGDADLARSVGAR